MKVKPKKINIITLGCAKNTVDSEVLDAQLKGNNILVTQNVKDADAVVINTCGFIEASKKQSIDTILNAIKLKEKNKLEKVFVMGCMVERYKKELQKEIPEVDEYFGTNNLPQILKSLGGEFKKELLGERIVSTPKFYSYLKISEGCDNPCSFCAIPLMRGKHKSKPIEILMNEVVSLVKNGTKELNIIAQDTTYYGLDLYGKRKLASLLKSLSTLEELKWIRLMYAYPAKFPLDILPVIAEKNNICKYLDMPIQHVSDEVLKSMRRGISRRTTEELIIKIKKEIPGIALRTTLIVGYPNETEKDLNILADFVEENEFDRLGVFTYSQEDDTTAFPLNDPISTEEKEARKNYIMEIQQKVSLKKNKARIGKIFEAVVEENKNGNYIGRTSIDAPEIDNSIKIISDNKLNIGDFVKVKITEAKEYDLIGKQIK